MLKVVLKFKITREVYCFVNIHNVQSYSLVQHRLSYLEIFLQYFWIPVVLN